MFIDELKSAFEHLGQEGYAEEDVQVGDHCVRLRTLSSAETAQSTLAGVETDGAATRIEYYIHTMKVEALSRAIIQLNGAPIPDIIEMGNGERQEKHIVLRALVSKWGEAVLGALYRAFIDLEERTEARVRKKVRYTPPDYQAAVDWHRQQIDELERKQKERERWLAMSVPKSEEQAVPEAPPQAPAAGAAPQPASPQGPPPVAPGTGRVRIDTAPPPPPSRGGADAPSVQLDEDSFLSSDPDVIQAALHREEDRLRLERSRRAMSAALIGTEAAMRPPAPATVDGPLARRAEPFPPHAPPPAMPEDPNELRRMPIPPGGPGRIELNPPLGELARNPRFQRRGP